MAASPPLFGWSLKLVSGLLRLPLFGPALRRAIGASVVDRPLASIDFAAEGEPPPLYGPVPYAPPRDRE